MVFFRNRRLNKTTRGDTLDHSLPSVRISPSRAFTEGLTSAAAGTAENSGAVRTYWDKYGRHIIVLAAIAAVANFLNFNTFGLYEDDWYFFVQPYSIAARDWLGGIWWAVSTFVVGRPLQMFFVQAFALLGAMCGSLSVLYVSAALLYSTSVALMYLALRHRFPAFFALLASLLFALSPLSTIRQVLHGVLGIAPGFIFLFLAFILYARRKNALSYALAVMGLLSYEPIFLAFVAAPFLRRGRKTRREIAAHIGIFGAILIAFVLVRLYMSEVRVGGAISRSSLSMIWKAVPFDIFHAVNSFLSYVYAAYVSFREPSWDGLCWTFALLVPALIVLFRCRPMATPGGTERLASVRRLWWIRNAVVPGAIFLVATYALSYWHIRQELTYPLSGRNTRISVGATFGSSVLVASLLCLALMVGRASWWKTLVRAFISVMLVSLFMYSFVVQKDYTNEWNHQRSVLAQLVMLTPDVTRDTLFVVQRSAVPETLFPSAKRSPSINTQFHGLGLSASVLFGNSTGPKIFFPFSDDWKRYLALHADGKLYWTQETLPRGWARGPDPKSSLGQRVISLVERDDGSLYRNDSPVLIGGQQVNSVLPGTQGKNGLSSNWNGFDRSPFLPVVLPSYVFTAIASNITPQHRSGVTSLRPNSGSGRSQEFVARISDSEGPKNIGGVFLMVQTGIEPRHSCWVYFDRPGQNISLARDDGSTFSDPIRVGSSGTLSNGQCTISGAGTRAKEKDNDLEVTIPVTFNASFKGSKKLFLYLKTVDDPETNKSTWQEKGSWLIP